MKFTIQVSSLDCTGCGVCVSVCPAFKKVNGEKTDRKAINMAPQLPIRDQEAANWEFFLSLPEVDPKLIKRNIDQGIAVHPAAVRVLRRLRRLRRDTVREAHEPALRRPRGHRQRHGLLVDLRREPSHHPVHHARRRPRTVVVQLAVRGRGGVRVRHAADLGQDVRVRQRADRRHRGQREVRGAHGRC